MKLFDFLTEVLSLLFSRSVAIPRIRSALITIVSVATNILAFRTQRRRGIQRNLMLSNQVENRCYCEHDRCQNPLKQRP